jgi:SWI/SNF-related matrix-associated actin-dependent regulator of chromatin subfamily A member 5
MPELEKYSDPLQSVHHTTVSTLPAEFVPGIKTLHKNDQKLRMSPIKLNPNTLADSKASTPRKMQVVDLTEDNHEDIVVVQASRQESPAELLNTPNTNGTNDDSEILYGSPKRHLRVRKPNLSLKATENGFVPYKRRRASTRDRLPAQVVADLSPAVSNRVAIRQEIASQTAAYRDRFLVEKKEFWLPLLPKNNYVQKLVEKRDAMSEAEQASLPITTPYEEIENQPRGVIANMKPYQLSGLSFMVFLHRNVRNSLA